MKYFVLVCLAVISFGVWCITGLKHEIEQADKCWSTARTYHITSSEVVGEAKVLHFAETDSVLIASAGLNPDVAIVKMTKDSSLRYEYSDAKGNRLGYSEQKFGVYFLPPHLSK